MTPGAVRLELYDRDVALSVDDGRLKYSAPEGALTAALLQEMKLHKGELLAILKAEAESNALHRRVFELVDAAEANELYGADVAAAQQRAEARALVAGPHWEASQRLLDLLGPESREPTPDAPGDVDALREELRTVAERLGWPDVEISEFDVMDGGPAAWAALLKWGEPPDFRHALAYLKGQEATV